MFPTEAAAVAHSASFISLCFARQLDLTPGGNQTGPSCFQSAGEEATENVEFTFLQ